MKYTFFGHACFRLDTGKEKLLFDPFLTGNGDAAVSPNRVKCDYILLSHAHSDHFGDSVEIARRTGATVVAIPEVIGLFPKTVLNFAPMNLGGRYKTDFATIKWYRRCTAAACRAVSPADLSFLQRGTDRLLRRRYGALWRYEALRRDV